MADRYVKKSFLLALLFISSTAYAAADYCSPVRLDAPGGSMEHVEVHNQRQIGDCYAHAAAVIFDAWRFHTGDREYFKQSSGFEINQRYKIYRDDDSIDGGYMIKALPLLVADGSCSEDQMNNLFKNITVDEYASEAMRIYHKTADNFYRDRANTTRKLYSSPSDRPTCHSNSSNQLAELEFNNDYRLRSKYLEKGIEALKEYHSKVLAIPYDDKRLNKIIPNFDVVAMFETVGIIQCDKYAKIRTPYPFSYERNSHYRWSLTHLGYTHHPLEGPARIHQELDLGLKYALPVGIGYCSKVLHDGRAFKSAPQFSGDQDCGRHASVAIGRRRNPKNNACEILIRNSWGKSCGSYSKDWECDQDKGSVWVDEKTLGRALYETETLKR